MPMQRTMRYKRKSWILVAAFCVTSGLSACRTGRGAGDGPATLATRDAPVTITTWRAPAVPLKACQHRAEPGMQAADAYLAQLAGKLMAQNPDTFRGEYAPERFCTGATARGRLGSHAKTSERYVVVHTESLRQARNDAEVAMVLARQLARVTMQEPAGAPIDLARYPGWIAAKQKLLVVQADAQASVGRLFATWRRQLDRRGQLESELLAALPPALKAQRQELTASYRQLVQDVATYGLAAADIRQELTALMPYDDVHDLKTPVRAAPPGSLDVAKSRELWQGVARIKERIEAQMARERKVAQAAVIALRKMDGELAHVADAYAEAALREENALSEMRGIAAGARLAAQRQVSDAVVDAAAFTIYLNAGFHSAFFRWQDEIAPPTAELAECRALIARAGDVRAATYPRHPLPCWRIYELEVLARRSGLPAWQPHLAAASTLGFTAGGLTTVQKSLPPVALPGAGAAGSPDGDLAILVPQ